MNKGVLKEDIFGLEGRDDFEELALSIFRMQARENVVYKKYISYLNISPDSIEEMQQIPFLPIEFFKTQDVILQNRHPEIVFTSSGTTGMQQSRHLVADVSYYEASFVKAFELFYGPVSDITILALLPSYQERDGSSLIYMVDDLIKQSKQPLSGYFLYNHSDLFACLNKLKEANKKTLLIGVTYALLDFIEHYSLQFPTLQVMETGGMKGRRKEMIREELHTQLCRGFGVQRIHSEYGMTELLSQAYSLGDGIFRCPPWMDIVIRDTNDPLSLQMGEQTGGINVIDLANVYSCSFIATQDLGRRHPDDSFEVLGRFDQSDIRGCNLLVS
ncbi:acyltransferase [Olivibacter sitiensis]|uniref:acyltransferase n=1 Tax=Olivibacter sitiensis TaxID=376470 RepID=UPI00040AF670|nr:acyltransferase [Olivibacter sitiensis]